MRYFFLRILPASVVMLLTARVLELTAAPKSVRKPYGLEKRVAWTTSRVVGSPDPPDPYRIEIAFPGVRFYEPLSMAYDASSNRFWLAERKGKIFSFANDSPTTTKNLAMDLGRTVYGIALHPRFAENGYLYVTYVLDPDVPSPKGTRVSRFQVSRAVPFTADPKSEKILLEWPSGGHNGGCLRFGPDGYLYIATGDGSGIADQLETGQDLGDLLASLLRIDVDHPSEGSAYTIPSGNPFVDMAGARPEIWAYGLRQAWKFSFDRRNSNLWAGEVGQDLWESIYLIQKGGNYGWSVNEGRHPFRPQRKRGPTPILESVVEHHHTEFRSITGGYVYEAARLPDLQGAYIYGDYDTGKVWSLRSNGSKVTDHRQLVDTQLRIIEFAQDAAGEVYVVDFMGGGIHRLVPAPPPAPNAPQFPRKLSETGLFTSTRDLKPAPGLIPYSVNSALWSDGATKERYMALPGESRIEYDSVIYPQPAPGALPGWRFPDGAVMVKTFSLEMETGKPSSARRLETRLLRHELIPGTEEVGSHVWTGYVYVWNDDQSDAELLEAAGADRKFTIIDRKAPGGKREQVWHFPSRAECTLCHNVAAKYVLGVDTQQLNRDHDYGGVIANQLSTLDHIGVFTKPLPAAPGQLPRLPDYSDPKASLGDRARGYLQANCAHCHRKWGGGNADFQLLYTLPINETGTIGVLPAHGNLDLANPRLITPGRPNDSMILKRMDLLGLGRMPHIASNVVDRQAVRLIHDWIAKLPSSGK